MNWTTAAMVVPHGEVASAPYEKPFTGWANPGSLHIGVGGSVELQRRDESGAWETFETVNDPVSSVSVANSPAIRFNPLAGTRYCWTWS